MRKLAVGVTVLTMLAFAAGAGAAGRWVISNINQIKPSVRHQLRGKTGPRGPAGAVPQIVLVQSEPLTLNPGQSSYDVDPNNFEATCPAGYTVIGTGFNGPFPPTGGFVQNYGTFVGGFFANESSIQVTDIYLQATCGQVPAGYTGLVRRVGDPEKQYHTRLEEVESKTH